jgi:hypothetical protein
MKPYSPYPDILFHFTNRSGLFGILSGGFRVSYSRERLIGLVKEKQFAVPIVSFCDLRLSELPVHMRKYGRYGIGLTKEWAQQRGLNPVVYMNSNSDFTNGLFEGLEEILAHINSIAEYEKFVSPHPSYMKIANTLRYAKNYEGPLIRRGTDSSKPTSKIYRFADEREWRYVLPIDAKNILPFVAKDHIATAENKQVFNQHLADHKLQWTCRDVKYLIVPGERNIPALERCIDGLRFSADERLHLRSRILTATQIEADM